MIYFPILFFAIAAIGGITLITMRKSGKGMPMSLALGHGIIAATGLVILLVNVVTDSTNALMNFSLLLFVVVALGGFTLFSFHLRKKALPDKLITGHGLGAIISFVLLLIAVFK